LNRGFSLAIRLISLRLFVCDESKHDIAIELPVSAVRTSFNHWERPAITLDHPVKCRWRDAKYRAKLLLIHKH
jgi:hypothetical protein